jgi:hypothetical protein
LAFLQNEPIGYHSRPGAELSQSPGALVTPKVLTTITHPTRDDRDCYQSGLHRRCCGNKAALDCQGFRVAYSSLSIKPKTVAGFPLSVLCHVEQVASKVTRA